MRVLFLSHRIPYPPDKGDKIRSFHELRYLSRDHEIDLVAFCDQPVDFQHADTLRRYCRTVTLLPLRPWRQRARAAIHLAGRKPWSLGYFHSREMQRAVRRSVSHVDIAFAYSSSMAPYVAEVDRIPKVIDFVDSDACKWQQYSAAKGAPARWLYAREARALAGFEEKMVKLFDCSLFVSPRETAHLSDTRKVVYIQNGIDLELYANAFHSPRTPNLVFVGAMDYFPNVDAVHYFACQVLPIIRRKCSDVCFTVVGSRPARAVRHLSAMPGVVVTGQVEDVRPHLAQGAVAVVPMRISQGIQNKILEALAAGLPVVASSKAAAGLTGHSDLPMTVADAPGAFAEAVLSYLERPLSRAQIESCIRILRQHYDWHSNLSALDSVLARLCGGSGSRMVQNW